MFCHCLIVVTLLAARVVSAKFSLPIDGRGVDSQKIAEHPLTKRSQEYLPGDKHDEHHAIDVKDPWVFFHTTTVSIGTPPQNFTMLIDVSFNVMMVPSSACEPRFSHCSGHPLFYGNESHTYHRSDERDFQIYALCRFYGWKSTDNVNINGLVVRDQPFIEADQINTPGFIDFYAFFDGPLALAPGQSSHSKVNSVFKSMVEQELLDENLFALRLPQGRYRLPDDENDPTPVLDNLGELTFGGVNHELYQGDFKAMPLTTNETDRELAGAWTVEALAATMETQDWTLSYEFNNTAARIESAWPHIGLPDALFRQLYTRLGLQECGAFFCFICDWRADMPDITFTLGNATNLTMNAFDYSLEMYRGNVTQCISAFMPNGDGGRKEERPAILLGSTFLRSFYTVFDHDKREVKFADLKRT